MSERLLVILLWDVLHGTIHRRAPRAFPWGRNLPRRHFLSFLRILCKSLYSTMYQAICTLVPGEIGCRLNCQMGGKSDLYRAGVSKGAGATSAHSQGQSSPTPAQQTCRMLFYKYIFKSAKYIFSSIKCCSTKCKCKCKMLFYKYIFFLVPSFQTHQLYLFYTVFCSRTVL